MLKRLNPVHAAAYDSYETARRPSCFENTHTELLNTVTNWIHDERRRRIYILYGIAGIGKSTVAKTVAEQAAMNRVLGSSFFFSRNEDNRKTAKSFFQTLAYHLAHRYSELSVRINEVLEEDRDVAQRNPRKQFGLLIAKPLQSIRAGHNPILIISTH